MRLLIIEDEISISKLLEYDFKQLGYTVDVAFDGVEGLKKAEAGEFDVIILDLMLPGMNGFDVCKALRLRKTEAHIIMLTAMDEEIQKIEGFEAGADDYVTKPFSPRELAARIKAVARYKKQNRADTTKTYENLTLNLESHEVSKEGEPVVLTLKEFELLSYLIDNKGIVLSRDQLLTRLWGYNYDGDTRVVDVHIFKLREKISILQEKIKTVRGIGYKLI